MDFGASLLSSLSALFSSGGIGSATFQGAGAAASGAAATTSTASTLAQAAAVASTLVSTSSTISERIQQSGVDRETAKASIEAARQDAFAERRRGARIIAKQQAGAAAGGLDVGGGSPLELLMDSAFNNELNALNIERQGRNDAFFFKNRAKQLKSQIPGIAFQGLSQLAALRLAT